MTLKKMFEMMSLFLIRLPPRIFLHMHPPSIDDVDGITSQLSVVKCVLAQLKESDDWHQYTIFQTLTKLLGHN